MVRNEIMKKKINYKTRGHRADIGPFEIYRLVSNNYVDHVGHFVFLDYIQPHMISAKHLNPESAHPHRGIATLTYILNGEADHYDSRGHRGKVHSGGVQWMKAGNGIIHNEAIGPDTKTGGKLMHGFQFWINLPAKNKWEDPEYMALQHDELPMVMLDNDAGTLKVVVGEYGEQTSKIPTYSHLYLYHIRLHPDKSFTLSTQKGLEYAAFLPQHDVIINNTQCYAGDLMGFDNDEGHIDITNNTEAEVDIILFGGEKYMEPYMAYGPFVMSTKEEIMLAHNDYMNGKYGKVVYS